MCWDSGTEEETGGRAGDAEAGLMLIDDGQISL